MSSTATADADPTRYRSAIIVLRQSSPVFTRATLYASEGTGYGPVFVSVRLPQIYVLSKRPDGRNNLFFLAWGLLSTSRTLCYKEIQVSSKIRVLFSETLL